MYDADLAPDDALLKSLRAMPKVVLHDHLDGGLRVLTLMELLRQRGLALPAPDAAGVQAWFQQRAHAGSLTAYLEGFALTIAAMATPQALERVAFEAAEDAHADGAVLAEFRIAPLLFERHGLSGDAVLEALLDGLARSALQSGLIVCSMRELPPSESERAVRLALRWQGRGVVGFDLAGAELGHPPAEHAGALALARDAGLPLTLHAGEADGAARVLEAVRLGARRIGHGLRLAEAIGDPSRSHWVDDVKASGVHLEVCPTSNVHTGAAGSVALHPIKLLWRAGVSLSFHTDNRLISCITHTGEAVRLVREAGFEPADLAQMTLHAVQHSFLPESAREHALAQVRAWIAEDAG
ncbi:MAG: adenosine deaminase [Burkholderiales bacterium]|jgi:adenosine deaminase|nr:adenosine deaminase [Burkholderiales bacterium]